MKIKRKLSLGLLFLFGVIILLITLAVFYVTKLSTVSEEVLKDNDLSIEYVDRMLQALDHSKADELDKALSLQEKNITEPGEAELTQQVREYFEIWRANRSDSATVSFLRDRLYQIKVVNRAAINRKNEAVQSAASEAKIWLGVIGTICFIVSFTIIINFPGYIANPISQLTSSIKSIANKNYEERLYFDRQDEFKELGDAFNQMAEKLDEYEHSNLASILFEKKRIETIINKMADPIIGLDEKKKILFVNTAALNILAIPESELIGQYAPDVAVRNDLLRHLLVDLMTGFPQEGEPLKPLKIFSEGKENYFTKDILKVSTVPTGEKSAKLVGYVVILKNITPFKELDLAKTNFIATISHELKTPLASIQMCSQLLEDTRVGDLNHEQKEILKTITEETERLKQITGELLNMAQVETGNIRLRIESVKPKDIIEYAHKALKIQAEQKHLDIEIQCPEDLPCVKADLDKTAWVMINLLSNAIHYSPDSGKIILRAQQSNGKVVFSVLDFGKGIDASYKDKVFDKFYRIPGGDSISTGTGLGLAISKDFITSEGGSIWVESEPDQGSEFLFALNV